MKVSLEQNNQKVQAEKVITQQTIKNMPKPSGTISGVNVDLFSQGNDNDAYKGAPKNSRDIMEAANMTDVQTNSDYMVVMSGCMSKEDFSKLLEEGTNPGTTEIETVVTIVDTIKAQMAKSGNLVAGYNDDLDKEVLKEITGSETFANKLINSFDKKDIPLTKENVEESKEVYDRVSQIDNLSDDATKYMVENHLEPTADNLYMASFSVKGGNDRQAKGYFANDMHGYYSQKAEVFNWAKLQPQMEKIIESAGYEVTDETLMDSMWIIKNGIPFTVESFDIYEKIKNIDFSQKDDMIFDAIATAIADGKTAKEAVLSESTSMLENAVIFKDTVDNITKNAVDLCVENDQVINIKNLAYWQKQINANLVLEDLSKAEVNLDKKTSAHLALEEVRLKMSVEANFRLLKSGYQIDVAPLSELVENLNKVDSDRAKVLFGMGDEVILQNKEALFKETVQKVTEIPGLPAATIAMFTGQKAEFTLNNVHKMGIALEESYKKANRSYETIMTAPRADMGDSIKKAFRNVDDILLDMEYAINEENRKAVRTLGYNNIPLTDENIESVLEATRQVNNVLDKLTPAAIMKMVRDGQNPLEMQMPEVEQYLLANEDVLEGTKEDKYGRYLYQLEQNNAISEEEREAYIGVCRLIHQINKSDGSALGSLIGSGMEINFKNLLSAVRSKNKGHMNTVIDDNTGLYEGKMEHKNSISAQIERIFEAKLKAMDGYEEALAKSQNDMLSDIQNLSHVSDNIISHLLQNKLPVTSDNIFAANALMNLENSLFGKIGKRLKASELEEEYSEFEKACMEYQDAFDSEEKAGKGVKDFTDKVSKILSSDNLESNAKAIDIKELSLLHKQVGMVRNFSENKEYQVPVYMDGNFTTIHLTLLKDDSQISSVNAFMETDKYGTVGSKFTRNNQFVEGYLVCENGFDAQTEETFTKSFVKALEKEDLQIGKVGFVKSKDVNPKNFGSEGLGEWVSDDKTDTKTLYAVAKAFIKAVQEAM